MVPKLGQGTFVVPARKEVILDFFNSSDQILKLNLYKWPEVKHHQLNRKKPLCIKYQAAGQCSASCGLAHMLPGNMLAAAKAAASKRFKDFYKTS